MSEPVRVGEVVAQALRAMRDTGPRVGQRVEVWIRDAGDLPHRFGNVTEVEEGFPGQRAYVSNIDDYVGRRPGEIFGMWVNAEAWNPHADDEVYGVRVVARVDET